MAHTFLLEIGLEEMPAHVVTPAIKQLVKRTADYLKKNASIMMRSNHSQRPGV